MSKEETRWLKLFVDRCKMHGAPIEDLFAAFKGREFYGSKTWSVDADRHTFRDMLCPRCGSDIVAANDEDTHNHKPSGSSLRLFYAAPGGSGSAEHGHVYSTGTLKCCAGGCGFAAGFSTLWDVLTSGMSAAETVDLMKASKFASGHFPRTRTFYAAHTMGNATPALAWSMEGALGHLNKGRGPGAGTYVHLQKVEAYSFADAERQLTAEGWERVKLDASKRPPLSCTLLPKRLREDLEYEAAKEKAAAAQAEIDAKVDAYRASLMK